MNSGKITENFRGGGLGNYKRLTTFGDASVAGGGTVAMLKIANLRPNFIIMREKTALLIFCGIAKEECGRGMTPLETQLASQPS